MENMGQKKLEIKRKNANFSHILIAMEIPKKIKDNVLWANLKGGGGSPSRWEMVNRCSGWCPW